MNWDVFKMIGEDGVIEVRKKINNSVVISAPLEYGYYHVYLIVHHGKIYMAATDFWYKALRPSSTRFWSTATDIYQDGPILPKRPNNYFCPQCG